MKAATTDARTEDTPHKNTAKRQKNGSKDAPLRFPGELGRRACRLVHGLKCRLHPVNTALEVFGMLVQVHEEALDVEGRASPLAKRRRQRRSARTARRGNLIVQ